MRASGDRRRVFERARDGRARDRTPRSHNHRLSRRRSPGTRYLDQPRDWRTGDHHPSRPTPEGVGGGQRRVTPRQTCPRPNGFGRNLRSKTRWFTGFCNSHQVSHFATFFIDARAEISVAESRLDILKTTDRPHVHRLRDGGGTLFHSSSLAQFAPVFGTPGRDGPAEAPKRVPQGPPPSGMAGAGGRDPPPPRVGTCSRVVLPCRFRQ